MERIYCENIQSLPEAAKRVISLCEKGNIWLFKGEMGVGKTTLIKAIGDEFEIVDQISSPSFSIVNEYVNKGGDPFYHFDFFRIDEPSEVLDIGIDDYFYSGHYCWIEWAEKIQQYLPIDFIVVKIEVEEGGGRIITVNQIDNGS